MRLTIRVKLFFILSSLILLFIFITQIFSAFFLERYYIDGKKNALRGSMNLVKRYLIESETPEEQLADLQTTKGVMLSITDEDFYDIFRLVVSSRVAMYTTSFHAPLSISSGFVESGKLDLGDNYGNGMAYEYQGGNEFDTTDSGSRHNLYVESLINNYYDGSGKPVIVEDVAIRINGRATPWVFEGPSLNKNDSASDDQAIVNDTDVYFANSQTFEITAVEASKTGFLCIISPVELYDGSKGYAVIQTSAEVMHDSIRAANEFVLIISLMILVIGTIVIFFVSSGISRHILRIAEVAKKMSVLDFSEHIKIKSQDEIGELAGNINQMSDRLSETISQLSMTNEELKESIMVKEKIDEARKSFIADVSHELKTPITLIGGYAEGLKLNVVSDDKDYYCDVIIDEAGKMNRLVLGLLDLMQLESGYTALELETFDMTELVVQTLDRYRLLFDEKHINVKTILDANVLVYADPLRIEQTLTNYIINAIKNVNDNGFITVFVKNADGKITASVSNTGKRIENDELEKIWDSFYKADKSRNRSAGGHGLGLSIVKVIMEAHGGEYGVYNNNHGVVFWFSLFNRDI